MELLYYRSPAGNFGDDLNAILWPELLPNSCFAADDVLLLGIGSILRDDFLSAAATAGKRVFVLGSGAGTGPLPSRWPNDEWRILAVRGPLSARLIGRPEVSITDGAALLATTPNLLPDRSSANEIVFFPHYNSVECSRWPEVCRLAGYTYVDARWPPTRVLAALGRARLVITEAMHGAIVADTLRVPWIPVVCSPAILPFKWTDWTKSVALGYRPVALPPSSAWEAIKHLRIRVSDRRHARGARPSEEDDDLIGDFHRRFCGIAAEDLLRRPALSVSTRSALQVASSSFDRIFVDRAAAALTAAAGADACLSRDHVLAERIDRLQTAVQRLVAAIAP
jgi:succinoglycan biosynthesis protein ExoV